jgi:hypothetical protein
VVEEDLSDLPLLTELPPVEAGLPALTDDEVPDDLTALPDDFECDPDVKDSFLEL